MIGVVIIVVKRLIPLQIVCHHFHLSVADGQQHLAQLAARVLGAVLSDAAEDAVGGVAVVCLRLDGVFVETQRIALDRGLADAVHDLDEKTTVDKTQLKQRTSKHKYYSNNSEDLRRRK
jgi:hypothetical protein